MRTYTVNTGSASRRYTGFDRAFKPYSQLKYVVLVQVEDTIEEWAIDDPKRIGSFMEFLAEQDYNAEHTQIIGCFERCK